MVAVVPGGPAPRAVARGVGLSRARPVADPLNRAPPSLFDPPPTTKKRALACAHLVLPASSRLRRPQLKQIKASGGDVAELALTFSVSRATSGARGGAAGGGGDAASSGGGGSGGVVDLCVGGREMAVTNANVLRYIHLLANYKLNVRPVCRSSLKRRSLKPSRGRRWRWSFLFEAALTQTVERTPLALEFPL